MSFTFVRTQTLRALILLINIVALANNCSAQKLDLGVAFPFYLSPDTIKSNHYKSIKITEYSIPNLTNPNLINEYFFNESGKVRFNLYTHQNISDTILNFEKKCDMDITEQKGQGISKLECNDFGQIVFLESLSGKRYNRYDIRNNLIESIQSEPAGDSGLMKWTFRYDSLNYLCEESQHFNARITYNKNTLANDTIYRSSSTRELYYKNGIIDFAKNYDNADTTNIQIENFKYFYNNDNIVRVEIRDLRSNELMLIATIDYKRKED